jgi:hypothetical protein
VINENEAIGLVKRKKGGTIEGCFGPSRIAGYQVWEVWAHDGDEYVTRFVVDGASTGPQYFASFGELCVHLDKKYDAQNAELARLSEKRHASTVRLYVAAAVFMAAVAVLLYLIARGTTPDRLLFGVLASLIASGGVMFYGAWRQVTV